MRKIVKTWESLVEEFGVDEDGWVKSEICFGGHMKEHCGKEVEVSSDGDGDYYTILGDTFTGDIFDFHYSKDVFVGG